MNIKKIEKLVSQGESSSLEFKATTGQLKAAFETVCAFLNSKGGLVLLGVKNNGQITGQEVTDNTRQEIARELKKIELPAPIEVHYVSMTAKKMLIVLEVSPGKHAPYTYDGRPYERVQSTTNLMPQSQYEQLLVRRGHLNHDWESQISEGYDLEDLDPEEIRRTVKEGVDQNRISVEVLNYDLANILDNLKLRKNGYLLNAAVALYARKVEPHYSHCMIRMARFKGVDKLGDFIDNQRVYGNAFKIISAAIEFIQRYLPIASFFKPDQMQRIDQPAVPMLALREALINAVSHRDYSQRSASIALAIYDDRLEIWNNGPLPSELKIEDLKKPHQSYPRNKIMASVFYQRGWVESWGTGTTRMAGYCKKNGTREPEFEEYSMGVAIVFKFEGAMAELPETKEGKKKAELNIRQEKILEILGLDSPLSASEIFKRIGMEGSLRTVKADLGLLRDRGYLDQVGEAKATLWRRIIT